MLKNNIIVITGGAGLLGREFARAILKNNGIPIITDVNPDLAKEVADNLKHSFPRKEIEFEYLDINDVSSIINVIHLLHGKYGKIDALVNNAYPRNKNYGRKFEDVTYEDFCENLNINLGGHFLISQQFLNYFDKQGYGNIVNIASIYGVIAPRFEIYENTCMTMPIEYAAIKSAIIHLAKYLAKYYKGKNIRINSISPGGLFDKQPETFVKTYNKLCVNKGMLESSDISGTLVYLLSKFSQFVNGQNIIVDDGFNL